MTEFIPGLRLNELFYREAVAPILARSFPGLRYGAARVGTGSEVLGFDDERSTDHEWGPRLILFLAEEDAGRYGAAIRERLREELPHEFRGFATSYGPPDEEGVSLPERRVDGPVNHKADVDTVARFVGEQLGLGSYPAVDDLDWLTFSEQALLEVTAGAVYHDGLGELGAMRAAFAYYPRDMWLYLLAAQWARISEQEAFVGRSGEVGDELGSALVAATLVRDLVRLWFLMERRYAPYAKWLGTAFARLPAAERLRPSLAGALGATTWRERERYLTAAYGVVAERHNALRITEPLATGVSRYHERPFLVINGGRFAEAIAARIEDPRVRALPPWVGSIDQYVDSTAVISNPARRRRLAAVYEGGEM